MLQCMSQLLAHLRHPADVRYAAAFGGKPEKDLHVLSFTGFETERSFGSIHSTRLSALVTDRAMEAWYHSSMA